VRSIEDLADANEEFLGKIGMGARRLKQLAADWVDANRTQGPLIAAMDTMRQQLEQQGTQIKELMAANANLAREAEQAKQASVGSRFPVDMPSPESRLADLKDNSREDEDAALDDVLRT
jgi:peptidoglycan hydrolase CwlO-like protein